VPVILVRSEEEFSYAGSALIRHSKASFTSQFQYNTMTSIQPTRALHNLTFDELSQLFAINFDYQPTKDMTWAVIQSEGCSICDSLHMLSLDWPTGELVLTAYGDVQEGLSEEELKARIQPITLFKRNLIREQLTAYNMAFI
jgi:hypothetical protein